MTDVRHAPRKRGPAPEPPAKPVHHLSAAERDAKGKAAREAGPAISSRRLGAARRPARSGRAARGAGRVARARARPDPLRADARVPVHVLPRRRLPHGRRPRGRAPDRPAGPALRRRPPLELRRASPRRTDGSSSASTTSTRRCPVRSSGTSSGSSRASRSPVATAGSATKERQRINRAVARAYREAMQEFAGMSNLDVWYARIDLDDIAAVTAERGSREAAQGVRAQRRQGAVEGQHCGRSRS